MRAVDRLHDAHRLSVLHGLDILDTDAEPAYDDLARLASICCDSKIAAVNFVDDERHWTKAIVGVEDGQGASLSAALSFCAATVASAEGQLSVPDTQRSERWRSHPLVAEGPTVGFYAGASIVVADEPIGVVCVFGNEPRALGEREEQALRALARQASAQLELRMRNAHLSELAVKDPLTFARTAVTFGDMRSLARSQELLEHNQLILDAAGDGICGLNRDGVVTFANPAAAALTGYAIDELIGRNLHATIHHSRADGSPYPYEECPAMASLRDGTVHHVDDDVYWSKDGSGRPVESTNTPIVKDGAVTGAVLVFKDITERKAAGAALQASEHRIRQILQTAHDAFFAMDCDGLITDWNPQAQASFGWSRDEVLGRDLAETIVPERDRDAHRRGLARFVATGKGTILGQRLQLRALHRDGHEFAIELTISPLQSANGWSFNAFARDITERKEAEQLLERQRQQLIDAQSVGGFGSWEWDLVTDTVEWSDELCRIHGMKPGCHPRSLLDVPASTHPDDRDRWRAELDACLTSGEPLACTRRIVRPDGSVRITHTRGEIVYDGHGKPLRMVGTGQDITE
ncbi:MAG: PAS domain S-box protein, partial [Solirubrobacteraceae bacterium]